MGLKINRGGGGEEKYFSSLFPNPPPFPTPPLSVNFFFSLSKMAAVINVTQPNFY